MLWDDFAVGLHTLYDRGTIILPHGCIPYGIQGEITEEIWREISWNPPAGYEHLTKADPDGSNKPTYATVIAIVEERKYAAVLLIAALRIECHKRINAAYGAEGWDNEIELRLRGDTTADQDIERDRLRAVCKSKIVEVLTMTPTQRMVFDAEDDSIWEEVAQTP